MCSTSARQAAARPFEAGAPEEARRTMTKAFRHSRASASRSARPVAVRFALAPNAVPQLLRWTSQRLLSEKSVHGSVGLATGTSTSMIANVGGTQLRRRCSVGK